jgi:hypothetical protein
MHRPNAFTALTIVAGFGLAAAGCSGGSSRTVVSSTAAPVSSAAAPATSATTPIPTPTPAHAAWTWQAGDFHVHTDHSGDGVDSVAESIDLCNLMDLDFVVFSDHESLTQTQDPAFVSTPELGLVAGYEWTDEGHAGLIGVQQTMPNLPKQTPGAWNSLVQDLVGNTHAQGGVFVLYHPAWNGHPWPFPTRDVDAVEVWNNFWTLSDTGLHPTRQADLDTIYQDTGMAAAGLSPSAEALDMVRQPGGGNDLALYYWESLLARGDKVAALGGSDRHKLLPPGYPTTWVLAPGNTQAEVLAAVRAGRTMVTQGPEGPLVDFEADGDGDGVFEATLGDELGVGTASLRVRVQGADGGLLRLFRDRHVQREVPIVGPDFTLTEPAVTQAGQWYRVEVLLPIDWTIPYSGLAAGLPLGSATSSGQVSTLLNVWGVSVAIGTSRPVLLLDEAYRRIVNLDLLNPGFSKGAITSPIYVR